MSIGRFGDTPRVLGYRDEAEGPDTHHGWAADPVA